MPCCILTDSKDCKEGEVSTTEELELELEALEINDDPMELEGIEEAEDLTKKLLDEQGETVFRKQPKNINDNT